MKRAEAIMAASLAKGCDVTVATGSGRVPFLNRDITPIALPDLKAEDISFSTLVSPTGDPLDPSFWDDRAQRLLRFCHGPARYPGG